MHIGLLECDHVAGRFPGIAGGYREMFAALLGPHAPGLRFTYYDACHGGLPAAPDACDAYLCTGSQFSATPSSTAEYEPTRSEGTVAAPPVAMWTCPLNCPPWMCAA